MSVVDIECAVESFDLPSRQQYVTWAKQCIHKFAAKTLRYRMLNDDVVVNNIANKLTLADMNYNGKGNREGWRKKNGKWAVSYEQRTIIRDAKTQPKTNHFDISHPIIDRKTADPTKHFRFMEDVINGSGLTEQEKDVVQQKILGKETLTSIAQIRGYSKQRISKIWCTALSKIARKHYGIEFDQGNKTD